MLQVQHSSSSHPICLAQEPVVCFQVRPSTCLTLLHKARAAVQRVFVAGFVNWVNTSKPPKYLWRTLAALLIGGQALVRILQGERQPDFLLHKLVTKFARQCNVSA